jgi:hypothetical protein
MIEHEEIAMSTHNESKDVKGRSWDQVTDGTTSAATMGAGATGEVGASAERKDPAADDLLAGGSNDEQSDQGFQGGANRQSGPAGTLQTAGQTEAGAADADDDEYDQGTARRG